VVKALLLPDSMTKPSDLIKPSGAERFGLFAVLAGWVIMSLRTEEPDVIPMWKHSAMAALWTVLFYLRILNPRVRHNRMRAQESLAAKQSKTLKTARKKMDAAAKAGKQKKALPKKAN
jgi:hypothetical protein